MNRPVRRMFHSLSSVLAVFLVLAGSASADLLYHLPFQDSSGNGTLDQFGTLGSTATVDAGNDGYYTNDVPPDSGGALAWYAPNESLHSDARIKLGNSWNTYLALTNAGDQITVMAWIKLDDLAGYTYERGIISSAVGGNKGWCLATRDWQGNDNYYLTFRIGDGTAANDANTAFGAISEGVWTHVAATWTAGGGTSAMKMYINAEEVSFTGGPANGVVASWSDRPITACVRDFVNWQLRGKIDDIRLYDEVLTQQQIYRIMKPPKGTVFILK